MKIKHISDFEGTKFEVKIDEAAGNCNDGDAIFISNSGEIVRVDSGLVDLFERQNDIAEWTKILMDIDFSE